MIPSGVDPLNADAIVVGGGVSGLATAYELRRRGMAVEVLEAANRGGGVIGTLHCDGALFETGPNSVLDSTPLINELLAKFGARPDHTVAEDYVELVGA